MLSSGGEFRATSLEISPVVVVWPVDVVAEPKSDIQREESAFAFFESSCEMELKSKSEEYSSIYFLKNDCCEKRKKLEAMMKLPMTFCERGARNAAFHSHTACKHCKHCYCLPSEAGISVPQATPHSPDKDVELQSASF